MADEPSTPTVDEQMASLRAHASSFYQERVAMQAPNAASPEGLEGIALGLRNEAVDFITNKSGLDVYAERYPGLTYEQIDSAYLTGTIEGISGAARRIAEERHWNVRIDSSPMAEPNPHAHSPENNRVAYTQVELRDKAAAFDQRFGNNARDFLNRPGEPMETYKFTASTSDGQQIERMFAATTIDGAAAQGWETIREQSATGVRAERAQLTWGSADAPEVEYIYDRRQGIELYRPAGLALKEAEVETLSERVSGEWTLQQFSEVAGKPWYALAERDEKGDVVRQFTGYRGEMEEFARQYGLKPRELPVIAESQFLAEQMKSVEAGAAQQVTETDYRLDQERRREWNALIEERGAAPVAAKEVKDVVEMMAQELVDEARQQHAQFMQLNERFEKAGEEERLQLREQMKPIALRENELRDRYLSLRQEDALGDFLQEMKGPSQGSARNGNSLERQTVTRSYGREETIRQLRTFASNRAHLPYVQAEAAIATNLANQLEAGVKQIDLSQKYATTDAAAAEERHRKAIENLTPVLKNAAGMTERLDYGHAVAAGQKEVLALNHDIRNGLARVTGVMQTAANHSHHVVQVPRLSMGEGLGGGGL